MCDSGELVFFISTKMENTEKLLNERKELFAKNLQSLITKLKSKFPPAETEDEATHLLTTEKVCDLIYGHNPTFELDLDELINQLKEAGYKFEAIEEDEEIEFRWMFGEG